MKSYHGDLGPAQPPQEDTAPKKVSLNGLTSTIYELKKYQSWCNNS